MTLRQITIYILIAAIVLLIGWDIFAYIKGGGEATISSVILDTSKEFPPLPFAFGVLCGHLFWPQKDK